uniref:UDP glucuronosyltransferase 5 family, polypeptide D1 n=1 Tax=Oryzias sinensis TaxID=183150 RepID=A0A8C7YEG0_9TELE
MFCLTQGCSALLVLLTLHFCHGGNILVIPAEGSHWINMDILLQALHSRGHSLTVVRSSKSWYIKENSSYYKTLSISVEKNIDEKLINNVMKETVEFGRGTLPLTGFVHMTIGMIGIFKDFHAVLCEFVSAMLDDPALIKTLHESRFDLVLADPCWGGGAILAKYLNLPLVYMGRWLIVEEAHFSIAPSPLSYVPVTGSGNTDRMTFLERVKNIFFYLLTYVQNDVLAKQIY